MTYCKVYSYRKTSKFDWTTDGIRNRKDFKIS